MAPVLLPKQPSVIPACSLKQPCGWFMDQELEAVPLFCTTPPPALQKEPAELELQQGSQLPTSEETAVPERGLQHGGSPSPPEGKLGSWRSYKYRHLNFIQPVASSTRG